MIDIIAEIEDFAKSLRAKYAPEVKTVENEAKAIGAAAVNYIETNGLKDLYAIAMSVLAGTANGTPWATTLASVVTQGEAAGIAIATGAEAVVLAQAQADMIAAGSLLPPVATAPAVETPAPEIASESAPAA